jgi:hypothetical protein
MAAQGNWLRSCCGRSQLSDLAQIVLVRQQAEAMMMLRRQWVCLALLGAVTTTAPAPSDSACSASAVCHCSP